jgi:hypothetical protein
MPKRYRRRPFAWATALLVWDIWRRLPPEQRKTVVMTVRRHGPRLAKQTFGGRKKR